MSIDEMTPRSRRAVLAAGIGAAAATVAGAVGRPSPVAAANPPVLLDTGNAGTDTTSISSSGLLALQIIGAVYGVQVQGVSAGLQAVSTGVNGLGLAGGAAAATGTGRGVWGTSAAADGAGVAGLSSASSTGVVGISIAPAGSTPTYPNKTGVYGYAAQDASARGVSGESPAGAGVYGTASTGSGVRGNSFSGTGVRGESTNGTGVVATADAGGTALAISGKVTATRAGRASVPANKNYVDVTVLGGLLSTAFVVATLQTYHSGVWVTVARNNYPTAGKVRIYLNKIASTTSSTVIGWIAIG